MKIRLVGAEFFMWTDRQTEARKDRHTGRNGEADDRFFNFTNALEMFLLYLIKHN
jgi:hypothetical protein